MKIDEDDAIGWLILIPLLILLWVGVFSIVWAILTTVF
jgi:hypothetical protein